jgi:hypothetical protein
MKSLLKSIPRHARWIGVAALLAVAPAGAGDQAPVPATIASMARGIAAELMMHCPLADADDAAAFESCRQGLAGEGVLHSHLPNRVLWGHHGSTSAALRQGGMTQLAPEVWTQLYAPLFMFNGNHQVEWVGAENQFVIRLEAAFRNRLAPGQFPHPFWHDPAQWAAYQHTNGVLLWVQPQTGRIHVAQFTERAPTPLLQPVEAVARRFDGQWLWTDAGGRTQPAVAQFDALYRAENPYLRSLDRQYRDLSLHMREAQCSGCHVPSNPSGAQRLVILSSPAHTAGEIDRLIQAVRSGSVPGNDGASHALSAEDRQWLLQSAEAYRDTVRAARGWEREAARRERSMAWQPAGGELSLKATPELVRR